MPSGHEYYDQRTRPGYEELQGVKDPCSSPVRKRCLSHYELQLFGLGLALFDNVYSLNRSDRVKSHGNRQGKEPKREIVPSGRLAIALSEREWSECRSNNNLRS